MVSDTYIFSGILLVFVLLGTLLPFIHDEFEGSSGISDSDIEDVTRDFGDEDEDLSFTDVIASIFSMFFWTFGSVWWVLDLLVLTPMRVVLVVMLVRWTWFGGGS